MPHAGNLPSAHARNANPLKFTLLQSDAYTMRQLHLFLNDRATRIPGHASRLARRSFVMLCAAMLLLGMSTASANAATSLGCSDDATGTVDRSSFDEDILAVTNAHRASVGLPALQRDPVLDNAALWKARDLGRRGYFAHDDPLPEGGVRTPWTRLVECGYTPANSTRAENIAAGQRSGADFAQAWINSPGHRANIENPALRYIGIGTANIPGSTYGNYSVQMFGSQPSTAPATPPPPAPETTSLTLVNDGSNLDVCPPAAATDISYVVVTEPTDPAVEARSAGRCVRVSAAADATPGSTTTMTYRAMRASRTSAPTTLRITIDAQRSLTGGGGTPRPAVATLATTLRGATATITSRPCRTRAAVRGRCYTLTVKARLRTTTGKPIAHRRVLVQRVAPTGRRYVVGTVASDARGYVTLTRAIRPPARGTAASLRRTYTSMRTSFAGAAQLAPSAAVARTRIR